MVLFTKDQSSCSTIPSCAFHSNCFCPGWMDFKYIMEPQQKRMCSQSGDHTTEYTACGICVRVDLSMPLRDHTFTVPSSPAVASAEPSKLHFKAMTAPRCASFCSTFFSSRPISFMSRKVPSAQPRAKTLSAPLLFGHHAIDVQYASS